CRSFGSRNLWAERLHWLLRNPSRAAWEPGRLRYARRPVEIHSCPGGERGREGLLMAPSMAPALRLRHILDEIGAIAASTQSVSFDAFRQTWLLKRAVEHGLL